MKKHYRLLIISFLILNLFHWIIVVEGKYGIPEIFKYILSVLVIGIIIYYMIKNPFKPAPGDLFYPLIIFFVLWSIILLIFGVFGLRNVLLFKLTLADPFYFIPYLLPILLLFIKFDLDFFGNLFYYSFIFTIPAILVQLLIIFTSLSRDLWYEQLVAIKIFSVSSAFLLLTAHISSKRYTSIVIIGYYLIWVFLWSFYGRRGSLVNDLLLFVFMIIILLRTSFLRIQDRIKVYLSGLLLILLIISFGYLFTSSYVYQRGFTKTAFEESRGTVIESFFLDFGSNKDLIFGRGINGAVLRSSYSNEQSYLIENGFLTMLLKGGFLYVTPFIIIILRAIYLGFFKSNNDLLKALASYIFVYFVMMVSYNLPSFTTDYIFVWISVTACFTASLRNHSDNEVYQALNSRFK
ncbi:MAG TPA: hypothetical protein GXX65_14040 [Methanosarcina sp.]|jgi:hypothetical protein|nr:hypothetical protein [Methanosarcina sp.]HPN70000.1 hypothetical protein [Saprospiraceae bacterium]